MSGNGFVNLRDFIYLDVERVKSLLAQLDKGLLNERSSSSGSTSTVEAVGEFSFPALFKAGGGGQYVSTNDATETRTLHDFIYNQTEEKLLELGRIKRFPADFASDDLLNEEFRSGLSPVEYVLVRGQVTIGDYEYMLKILRTFNEILRITTEFSFQDRIKSAPAGKERDEVNREMTSEIAARKIDEKYLNKLVRLIEFFLSGRLNVKMRPFPDNPNVRIAGPLQESHLRDSLADIRFKFGSSPSAEWTMFGQIAAVPQQDEAAPAQDLFSSNAFDLASDNLFTALRGIEKFFRVSYPEIAITPIAIYRD